jgi:hypothetical protein
MFEKLFYYSPEIIFGTIILLIFFNYFISFQNEFYEKIRWYRYFFLFLLIDFPFLPYRISFNSKTNIYQYHNKLEIFHISEHSSDNFRFNWASFAFDNNNFIPLNQKTIHIEAGLSDLVIKINPNIHTVISASSTSATINNPLPPTTTKTFRFRRRRGFGTRYEFHYGPLDEPILLRYDVNLLIGSLTIQ